MGTTTTTLTEDELIMLDIEKARWLYPGAKEAHIREALGLTATRFYQRVNQLIDTEAALAHDPLTVKRLRRQREARRRQRASRRLGFQV